VVAGELILVGRRRPRGSSCARSPGATGAQEDHERPASWPGRPCGAARTTYP